MGKRPRIKSKIEGNSIVEDVLEFKANKGSKNARYIESIDQKIILDLWHEKHYTIRHQHGDENGQRDGIEPELIKELVQLSLKHLIYYSANIREFAFLNHNTQNNIRVVLQDSFSADSTLNVPIEVHFIDFFKYEVTVFSALRTNGFRIGDGQYALELSGEYDSILRRNIRGQITKIGECVT